MSAVDDGGDQEVPETKKRKVSDNEGGKKKKSKTRCVAQYGRPLN